MNYYSRLGNLPMGRIGGNPLEGSGRLGEFLLQDPQTDFWLNSRDTGKETRSGSDLSLAFRAAFFKFGGGLHGFSSGQRMGRRCKTLIGKRHLVIGGGLPN